MASLCVWSEAALVTCGWRVKVHPDAELELGGCYCQMLLQAAHVPAPAGFAELPTYSIAVEG